MITRAFYMKSLDDINTDHLPKRNVQARKMAQSVSMVPTFVIYAILLPLLMIIYYCHQPSGYKAHLLFFNFIIKPVRWVSYYIIYLLCIWWRSIFLPH